MFVSSHLITELAMFADDLVVVGAGKLLAAEPVAATLARGDATVSRAHTTMPRTRTAAPRHDIHVEVGRRPADAARHDHRCRLADRLRQPHPGRRDHRDPRSLEEILLDITGASAEFAAA